MISVEPRKLLENEIEGISDKHERLFAITAQRIGFKLYDGGMITLQKASHNRGEKRSTNPDFYIKTAGSQDGYYIEITRGENLGGRKNGQRNVMMEEGLADKYFQLTGSDVEIISKATNLADFINLLPKRK